METPGRPGTAAARPLGAGRAPPVESPAPRPDTPPLELLGPLIPVRPPGRPGGRPGTPGTPGRPGTPPAAPSSEPTIGNWPSRPSSAESSPFTRLVSTPTDGGETPGSGGTGGTGTGGAGGNDTGPGAGSPWPAPATASRAETTVPEAVAATAGPDIRAAPAKTLAEATPPRMIRHFFT